MKLILDSIGCDDQRKRELIRGDAVDKAEQLSKREREREREREKCHILIYFLEQVRLIQEKLDSFRDALSKQQKRQ